VIIVLYLGANIAYIASLPLAVIAREKIVAVPMMAMLVGPVGGLVVALLILASVLGSLNGVIMTKSRVAFSLARDGLSFRALGNRHSR
jgi:APA family basic amino acid/polyamine antiporter